MAPRVIWPDPHIDAVRGCVAIERGPEVLALESTDLGAARRRRRRAGRHRCRRAAGRVGRHESRHGCARGRRRRLSGPTAPPMPRPRATASRSRSCRTIPGRTAARRRCASGSRRPDARSSDDNRVMTRHWSPLALVYLGLAVAGMIGTWWFNALAVIQMRDYLGDLVTSGPAVSSFTVDLLIVAIAGSIFIVVEARRLRMRFGWLYVVGGGRDRVRVHVPAVPRDAGAPVHGTRSRRGVNRGTSAGIADTSAGIVAEMPATDAAHAALARIPAVVHGDAGPAVRARRCASSAGRGRRAAADRRPS